MYRETRKAWKRRQRRRQMLQRILTVAVLVAAVAGSVPVINALTGHDVVELVSEQSKKERPDGIMADILPEESSAAAETVPVPETTAAPETEPAEPETEAWSGNPAEAPGWNLILVNRKHPIPEGYQVPEFTELRNDNRVDSRIYPSLQEMFDDMRAEGLIPYITSSYRSSEKQQALMDQKIADYEAEGNSHSDAVALAEKWVAIPGTSEHQLGLSVDISSGDKEKQEPSVVWEWLNRNCWKYGFVQRYPEDKTDVTGIIDEPWHYRYVGKEAAKEMTELGVVLEEYLAR